MTDRKGRLRPGGNIAMKVPVHLFEACVAFYRDVVELEPVKQGPEEAVFRFGALKLWLDRREHLSQAETWLELFTDDTEAAADHLAEDAVQRRDDIEPLPEGSDGFWITDPAGVIHLVTKPHD